ncbi:ferritin-like domain-containing protein [Allonocardiopsis opalescens]|uniref:Uncharacterized protein DUF4439 n=1 Tax=Allonocardiopsis opalescens TaxID=1144618 RepID=A0A2T0QF97_9ACTN|nr:ferritin-like domain-containing protein [Allonocardiopsis opalescens]PRY02606.1 uncharacterized protein DUF4439 [Allonocardiopsis opalescens]
MSRSPDPAESTADPALAALQTALRAEHAAIFGYGRLGPELSGGRRQRAVRDIEAHRARRDGLRRMVLDRGGVPERAAPAYELPGEPDGAEAAARVAAQLEWATARAQLALAAVPDPEVRAAAGAALQDSTLRALSWSEAEVPAWPGYPDDAFAGAPSPSPAPAAD